MISKIFFFPKYFSSVFIRRTQNSSFNLLLIFLSHILKFFFRFLVDFVPLGFMPMVPGTMPPMVPVTMPPMMPVPMVPGATTTNGLDCPKENSRVSLADNTPYTRSLSHRQRRSS
jgi:hypothetical protein